MNEPMKSEDRLIVHCVWAVVLFAVTLSVCISYGNGPGCRQPRILKQTMETEYYPSNEERQP